MATKKTKKVAVKVPPACRQILKDQHKTYVKKRPTRCEITAALICEGNRKAFSLPEIIAASDKRHSELGGKRNIKEATFSTKRAVSICCAIGLAEMCDGKIRVIGKVV